MADRSRKFVWGKGDIKVQMPQCKDCINNVGPTECKAFGTKPDKYTENKFECPEKVTK